MIYSRLCETSEHTSNLHGIELSASIDIGCDNPQCDSDSDDEQDSQINNNSIGQLKFSDRFKEHQWSRYTGLIILVLFLLSLSFRSHYAPIFGRVSPRNSLPGTSILGLNAIWNSDCIPGKYRNSDQMQYSYWKPPSINGEYKELLFPLYTTDDLDVTHHGIKKAIILQHGNLRNGNEYFCAAINTLRTYAARTQNEEHVLAQENALPSPINLDEYVVIAPQFLIEDDYCWYQSRLMEAIRLDPPSTCNLPIVVYSNEGWKDGHLSLLPRSADRNNTNNIWNGERMHSYEIFNRLIDRLSDASYFPNLEDVTLFGFSAGAQTLVRYAAFPRLAPSRSSTATPKQEGRGGQNGEVGVNTKSDTSIGRNLSIRYVVSDPSTFMYLDETRPYTNGSAGFGVPSGSLGLPSPWLPLAWSRSSIDGMDWLSTWNESCASYNTWRYGLDKVEGYYKDHHAGLKPVLDSIIANFPNIDMTYLVATNDNVNCKLDNYPGCNDNDLATYCQAMLQGTNRLDRALKWKAYLRNFYGKEVHSIVFVEGIQHDPQGIINSDVGRCVIFGACL